MLVTDDTPANRQLVGLVLRKSGLTVEEAENGLQAVEKAQSGGFDLLLMDMQMPVMDGFTATRKLRDLGITQPIIALTANVMQSDRERCETAGCSGFLPKPIDIDKLLNALSEVLEVDQAAMEKIELEAATAPNSTDANLQQESKTLADPPVAQCIDDVMKMVENALAKTTSNRKSGRGEPIHSTLPLEIPEFREIVTEFVHGLPAAMDSLKAAWNEGDFHTLKELAHKLKGTGGTVGFAQFTNPSMMLQQKAEQHDSSGIDELLDELEGIASRVCLPDVTAEQTVTA